MTAPANVSLYIISPESPVFIFISGFLTFTSLPLRGRNNFCYLLVPKRIDNRGEIAYNTEERIKK